ncbi:MAG: hypothetical protein EXQ70_09300 [Solirubrobacterales bacterium]|nr:hypothetical protein [Solirubrobacterales bacterium]
MREWPKQDWIFAIPAGIVGGIIVNVLNLSALGAGAVCLAATLIVGYFTIIAPGRRAQPPRT